MSELRTYDVIMTPSSDGSWVLKSEAKRVIAEKDREIRHHKYGRCLDRVEICKASSVYFFRISETTKDEGAAIEFRRISDWYDKWEERWLKLAEKFEEAK